MKATEHRRIQQTSENYLQFSTFLRPIDAGWCGVWWTHTQLVTGANFYQEVEVEDGGGDGEVGGTG